jgi:hypothetical protein
MPRNLPHYTTCAAPGNAYAITQGGSIAMGVFVSLVGGAIFAGGAATILSAIAGHIAAAGCIVGTGIAGVLLVGLLDFKDWYYHHRLMCIQHDECAAGTVVGEPHDSFDGDRKIDILVAPFQVPETEQLQIQALVDMGAAGDLVNVPDAMDLQNRQIRFGYMRGLSQDQQEVVQVNVVDNYMFSQPGRDFLRHLYRRIEARMGTPAFDNSPDDTGSDPNPLFRVNPQEGEDPEEKQLVPYMHTEVEGNAMARFLDNLIAAVVAFLAVFVAGCIVCEVVTMGAADWLCGWAGAGLAALFAFLVWLLMQFGINPPEDGNAGEIDVDVEDPDFDTPPAEARRGDVVFLYGDWVMDEEHGKYMEIHPVKAYYLLCRSERDTDDWVLTEEIPAKDCEFDVRELDGAAFDRICRIVKAVEETDPDEGFTTTISAGLSMMPAGLR